MICAISREEISDPIVSPKSGAVFERRHIEKYVTAKGTDPISNEPLTLDELIPLQITAYSAENTTSPTANFTSIPNTLSMLQKEYDSMVSEIFTLRKSIDTLKEELSISLYRVDAAINVATKALEERDEAKKALENLSGSLKGKLSGGVNENESNGDNGDKMEDDNDLHNISDIHAARDELFKKHKALKVKLPYKLDKFTVVQDKTIYKTFGVHADLVQFNSLAKVLTGTHKSEVLHYNVVDEKLDVWKTKLKTIGQVVYNNNGILAAVAGTKISFSTGDTITIKRKVLSINSHPSLNLFVITSAGNWYVSNTNEIIATHPTDSDLIHGDIHGDGEIFAAYNGEKVKLLSLISGDELAAFDVASKHVQQISFAANGYWLLVLSTSDDANTIQIFDLRKSVEANRLELSKEQKVYKFIIDPSSNLLVVATNSNCLTFAYLKKTRSWNEIELLGLGTSGELFFYSNGEDVVNDGEVRFICYDMDADNSSIEKLIEKETI